MFKQAVSSFEAKKPAPKPATQPSAAKVPKQISIDNALKATSQPFHGIQPTGPLGSSGTQNRTNPPFRPPIRAGSMRQKAINDISATFNHISQSFQENIQPAQSSHDSMQQSSVEALQDAVYWEADDFDDGDLDFDSEPFVPPKLAAAAASLPSPKAPAFSQLLEVPPPKPPTVPSAFQHFEAPPSPRNMEIPSSAPLPWSSSPVEHLVPNPPISKTAQKLPPVTEQEPLSPPIAPASRRRKLPWASEQTAPVRTAKVARRELSTKTKSASTKTTKSTEQWTGLAAEQIPAAKKGQQVKRSTNAAAAATSSGTTDTVQHESGAKLAKSSNIRPAKIFLSEEQKTVVKLVSESKRSVFFTGPAGTGKSVLLREVIATLKTIYRREQDAVAVTASTGLAACNIGGVTLHSFAGIGLGKEPVPDLVRKIKRNIKAKNRWLRTKVLIIDEISMVDGDLFDKLEAIARQIRNNAFPFGGIQLVITGDFFQLPPIPGGSKPTLFAFDAKTWETAIAHTIGLTHVFRQRDPQFAAMLNEMRLGYLSQNTIETFKKLQRPLTFDDGLSATELFSTRPEVERSNNMKLRSLPGESLIFNADDSGGHDKQMRDKLLSSCMAPATIELKVNAQVMLIKNLDDTLVNGSLGRVVGFMNDKMYEIVNEYNGLDMEWDDKNGALTKRQEKIRSMARGGNSADTGQRWPLVSFSLADGTSRQILVQPELWKVELPNGEIQAQRSQLPLILAWALSIHKAQGQTLERVKVDLGRAFEKGQAYVALSRATCKEGLQVLGFQAAKVMAHEKVREFYKNLSGAEEAKKALEEEKKRLKEEAKQRLIKKGSGKASKNTEEDYPGSDEF